MLSLTRAFAIHHLQLLKEIEGAGNGYPQLDHVSAHRIFRVVD